MQKFEPLSLSVGNERPGRTEECLQRPAVCSDVRAAPFPRSATRQVPLVIIIIKYPALVGFAEEDDVLAKLEGEHR